MTQPAEPSSNDLFRQARLFNVNPLVGCIDNFASPDTVADIERLLQSAPLEDAQTGSLTGAIVSDRRTAKTHKIQHGTHDVIDDITAKIAGFLGLKNHHCEYPELISYGEGEEFKRHFDAALSGSMQARGNGDGASSQRIFTAVLYLNHDFDGGKTVFPRLGVELTPQLGRLAFWQNTKPGSAKAHANSMHEGCRVTSGNKRIVSFWFRDARWQLE